MNTGLITSFAIGGILLLAILAMNLNVSHSSAELTMTEVTRIHVNTVSSLLEYDIPKIGYDKFSRISNPISVAKRDDLVFRSNLNRNGVKQVTWYFKSAGSAPGDNVLKRTVDGNVTDLNVGVTGFKFIYFDKNLDTLASPVSDRSKIYQINVSFTVSSKEKLGQAGAGSATYTRSFWEKTFSPKNLK